MIRGAGANRYFAKAVLMSARLTPSLALAIRSSYVSSPEM